jgi:hypothetical protein
MGVGAPRKAPKDTIAQSSTSATSFVAPPVNKVEPILVFPVSAAEAALPPSYDNSEINELKPHVLLKPTHDHDLEYFHAVAAGDLPPHPPSSNILVMDLFRRTQKHLFPLDERIALGSSIDQPFYSLLSGPSSTSIDEFNKLTISRRDPAHARWSNVCISEIRPRLRLLAAGVMIISEIVVTKKAGTVGDKYTLTWEKAKDMYTVWADSTYGTLPFIDITMDNWESLDDIPGDDGGVVRVCAMITLPWCDLVAYLIFFQAKLRSQNMLPSHNDLAVLDATKPSLQFISTSLDGHRMMDLLVGSLLTVGIVHSRMAKLGRAANARLKIPVTGKTQFS